MPMYLPKWMKAHFAQIRDYEELEVEGMQWLKKYREFFEVKKILLYLDYIGSNTIVGICQTHRAEH